MCGAPSEQRCARGGAGQASRQSGAETERPRFVPRQRRRRWLRVLACVLALAAGGCGIGMDLPEPFLQLHTSGRELKATTPDDARLWVREFEDQDQGGLPFWAATLHNELTGSRGYELIEQSELRDGSGCPGRLFELRALVDGERWGYLVAVFVRAGTWSNTICVAEFVAREDTFTTHAPAIRTALTTLRP